MSPASATGAALLSAFFGTVVCRVSRVAPPLASTRRRDADRSGPLRFSGFSGFSGDLGRADADRAPGCVWLTVCWFVDGSWERFRREGSRGWKEVLAVLLERSSSFFVWWVQFFFWGFKSLVVSGWIDITDVNLSAVKSSSDLIIFSLNMLIFTSFFLALLFDVLYWHKPLMI